jgi:hypothetical protein
VPARALAWLEWTRFGGQRGKCKGLSRVQRGRRCSAPYFPVLRTERAIVRRYKRETYKDSEQRTVREALEAYVEAKAEVAHRESQRHARRVRELTAQQQKLVHLFYHGGVSEEVLKAEQERISAETAQAHRWTDAARAEKEHVMEALADALLLLNETVIYERLPHSSRRLVNQAVFVSLIVIDPDTILAHRTPVFDEMALLSQQLHRGRSPAATSAARSRPRMPRHQDKSAQDDHDLDFRGRGSCIEQMAASFGFGPGTPRSSAGVPPQEVDEQRARLRGLVVPDEMPGLLENRELRAGQLLVEALRHRHAGEAVLPAPHDQRGEVQRGDAALEGDELLELARAVQLELREAPAIVGECLPVVGERLIAHAA